MCIYTVQASITAKTTQVVSVELHGVLPITYFSRDNSLSSIFMLEDISKTYPPKDPHLDTSTKDGQFGEMTP